jgi:formyltetrahydrofolate deformylase
MLGKAFGVGFGGENFVAVGADGLIMQSDPLTNSSPSVIEPPLSQTVTVGTSLQLTVTASGSSPLSYQWRKDDVAIVGATEAVLTLTRVQLADAGSYTVVISNHDKLAPLAERFHVPFRCVPHYGLARDVHDRAVLDVLSTYNPDFVVLAKYMRILGPEFVERYRGRLINIHHSFLPAFVGANPYRQAFEHGVKMIGATAHFVSEVLDEGPIIAQATVPVDHSRGPAEMAMAGRDVEKIVLAKALKLVLEDRVFLNGRRTLVFD